MRKGHRRTQSDTIHISQKNISQAALPSKQALSHLQITKLLNICNQKAKQKVSNVEVLSQPTQNTSVFFQFGHSSHKKIVQPTQSDCNQDYLASIPQRKQSAYQDWEETTPFSVKQPQFKDKQSEQAFHEKCRRLPFFDAFNTRPRERRKAQPEKIKQNKKPVRTKLGFKLKF